MDSQRPLEILEAGTGHGSVTLHLARAIQAANPPVPDIGLETSSPPDVNVSYDAPDDIFTTNDNSVRLWQDWRKSRRAVVHSVEVSAVYSKHAEKKVVAGFRRGLYLPHIDFHVANVNDWVDQQLAQRSHATFLSYVFLDMPSCHRYLEKVATSMKEDALLAVFVPSITQIGDCVQQIKAKAIPLKMEKALELGDGISNGRLWDVRLARRRAKDPVDKPSTTDSDNIEEQGPVQEETGTQSETCSTVSQQEENGALPPCGINSGKSDSNEEPVMVCRPKVGERIVGGGFVGLWRRIAPH